MFSWILIIDSVLINCIVFKVKLLIVQYDVLLCVMVVEVWYYLIEIFVDLIVLDFIQILDEIKQFCISL